ncbi:Vacuolar protein sorting-associated protein 17 [Elsinoe australis]|uniref:Vacuolar protein sorting-associated protein 17 n=1 Tax=Elsinoe australis TaxID=40998 RepID=A0A2P8ABD1_9PEZI|nr:Vacuolar protein sorting-associated protein 17 [Elsinoe australis]
MTGTSDSDGMQEKKDSPMDVDFPNKEPESDYQPEPDEIYRSDLLAVRPVPNAGLGLFATAPIPAGTRLIRESPLLTLSDMADLPDLYAKVIALSPSRRSHFWSLAAYRRRHDEVDWIPAIRSTYGEDCDDFDALCDKVLHAWLIYETNRFTVRSEGGARDQMGLFPLAARLNHSCRPNVFHRHNHLIGRLTIHALRDIEAGEEVCTSYIDVVHPMRERRRILRHWGFKCACGECRHPGAAGEHRRKRLEEMTAKMRKEEQRRAMMNWDRWDYARSLGVLEEMVALMGEEGLDESDTLGEVVGLGAEYAMNVGWWDMAKEWAQRACEIEERCLGRDGSEWLEARERLAEAEKGPAVPE